MFALATVESRLSPLCILLFLITTSRRSRIMTAPGHIRHVCQVQVRRIATAGANGAPKRSKLWETPKSHCRLGSLRKIQRDIWIWIFRPLRFHTVEYLQRAATMWWIVQRSKITWDVTGYEKGLGELKDKIGQQDECLRESGGWRGYNKRREDDKNDNKGDAIQGVECVAFEE